MTTVNPPRRTRKTRTRHHNGSGLSRIHWGWYATAVLVFAGSAKTWPAATIGISTLLAITGVIMAIRPARLAPVINRIGRITARRRILPNPHHNHRPLHLFQQMNPTRFEHAIAELAREDDNVHSARQVGQANDRGADVLVHMRDGRRILIQCKHYQPGNNVGSETIQTINGVYRDIHHCQHAVIVTTAGFTRIRPADQRPAPQAHPPHRRPRPQAWANGGRPPWA
jgi:restriction system protein